MTRPRPEDVQAFQFDEWSERQIFDGFDDIPVACNLVAVDNTKGLLYAACGTTIKVLKYGVKSMDTTKFSHELPYTVHRISLSKNGRYLAVTFNYSTARIYETSSFLSSKLELHSEICINNLRLCQKFGSPPAVLTAEQEKRRDVFAYDLKWASSPACSEEQFCTVSSDGMVGCFELFQKSRLIAHDFPEQTIAKASMVPWKNLGMLCIDWCTNGKQLVVGCKNRNILLLNLSLTIERLIQLPSDIGRVISIQCIAQDYFFAAYYDTEDRCIHSVSIDAQVGKATEYHISNTFGHALPELKAEEEWPQCYKSFVPNWKFSVNILDVGYSGPLFGRRPVGLAIGKSCRKFSRWPGTHLIKPLPVLHVLCSTGQLMSFESGYTSKITDSEAVNKKKETFAHENIQPAVHPAPFKQNQKYSTEKYKILEKKAAENLAKLGDRRENETPARRFEDYRAKVETPPRNEPFIFESYAKVKVADENYELAAASKQKPKNATKKSECRKKKLAANVGKLGDCNVQKTPPIVVRAKTEKLRNEPMYDHDEILFGRRSAEDVTSSIAMLGLFGYDLDRDCWDACDDYGSLIWGEHNLP